MLLRHGDIGGQVAIAPRHILRVNSLTVHVGAAILRPFRQGDTRIGVERIGCSRNAVVDVGICLADGPYAVVAVLIGDYCGSILRSGGHTALRGGDGRPSGNEEGVCLPVGKLRMDSLAEGVVRHGHAGES